jgi:hypothetical protein
MPNLRATKAPDIYLSFWDIKFREIPEKIWIQVRCLSIFCLAMYRYRLLDLDRGSRTIGGLEFFLIWGLPGLLTWMESEDRS